MDKNARSVNLPSVNPGGRPSIDSDNRLREILRAALRQALVPGLSLGLLACGGDAASNPGMDAGGTDAMVSAPDGGGGDARPLVGFEKRACPAGQQWNPTLGLSPASPADYVSYVGGPGSVALSSGSACATATDKNACLVTVGMLEKADDLSAMCDPAGCPSRVVVNRGDEVRSIGTVAELVAFLGTIDTAQEAAFVAFLSDYNVVCDSDALGGVKATADGFEIRTSKRISDCPVQMADILLRVTSAGVVTELKREPLPETGACIGRRPDGLQPGPGRTEGHTVASFLAECAALEAASVPAFVKLADDLRANRAPRELIALALVAADDEVRHARMMAALAGKYGGQVSAPRVLPTESKSLFKLALENAVEGCVRETFGALVGAYQAASATDPGIRAVMASIAEDEFRHAALAWQIAEWCEPLLDGPQRLAVRSARDAAALALRAELRAPVAAELYTQAGWPPPAQADALVDALDRTLWSAAA